MAPPIQNLDHWTLVTSDVARTKRFYIDALGATEVDREWPPSVVLGGITIDMFAATGAQPPQPGSGGQHHAYAIRLEDYDAWTEHLRGKGVAHRLAHHGLQRMSIYVKDPDGYHIELVALIDDPELGRREIDKRSIRRFTNPAGPQGRP